MALEDLYVEVTAVGIQGLSGQTAAIGATGPQGLDGATGAQGLQGNAGATGTPGIDGASGAQGLQGVDGATGVIGSQGASGISGATGVGVVPTTVYTTSTANEELVDTIDTTLVRSVKYEMQETYDSMYCASELRLLHDEENAFLTQYGSIGSALGMFNSYFSPFVNNYSSPQINNGGISYWNGTTLRIYTSNSTVIQALLSITPGTSMELDSTYTITINTKFIEIEAGIYEASTIENQTPIVLLSNISWTGTGMCELRYTGNYTGIELKYKKTEIEV